MALVREAGLVTLPVFVLYVCSGGCPRHQRNGQLLLRGDAGLPAAGEAPGWRPEGVTCRVVVLRHGWWSCGRRGACRAGQRRRWAAGLGDGAGCGCTRCGATVLGVGAAGPPVCRGGRCRPGGGARGQRGVHGQVAGVGGRAGAGARPRQREHDLRRGGACPDRVPATRSPRTPVAVSGRVVETVFVFDRHAATDLSVAYGILVPERATHPVPLQNPDSGCGLGFLGSRRPLVLVDQAAEDLPAVHRRPGRGLCRWIWWLGWLLVEGLGGAGCSAARRRAGRRSGGAGR